jgi:hypothetical protein
MNCHRKRSKQQLAKSENTSEPLDFEKLHQRRIKPQGSFEVYILYIQDASPAS